MIVNARVTDDEFGNVIVYDRDANTAFFKGGQGRIVILSGSWDGEPSLVIVPVSKVIHEIFERADFESKFEIIERLRETDTPKVVLQIPDQKSYFDLVSQVDSMITLYPDSEGIENEDLITCPNCDSKVFQVFEEVKHEVTHCGCFHYPGRGEKHHPNAKVRTLQAILNQQQHTREREKTNGKRQRQTA